MRCAIIALAAPVAFFSACGLAEPPRPNIIVILADDLGVGDLSANGQQNWQTPRLDRMAAEGLTFTKAYAGSAVCAPSRAAMLTGQHTGRGFIRGNGRIALRRDPEDITIAARLRDLGYDTAMVGKSGVACLSTDLTLPNDKGFDHFFGLLDHAEAHRQYPPRLVRNGEWVDVPGNQGFTGDTYANELFVQDALAWIESRGDRPFFLHLALTVPHADLTAPEPFTQPFRGRFTEPADIPKSGYLPTPEPRAAYAGMVAFLDDAVGRVLDAVEARGLSERTLVLFASDNGPHAEGGADPEAFNSNGDLRGRKRDVFEGGLRTPQIARWPGTIPAGARTDTLTAFWDFPPTALELAGADTPNTFDGLSLAPTLTGRPDDQKRHRYLYWELHEEGGKQAVRFGNWKAVRLNVDHDPAGPIQLYDLAADPGENTDLAAANASVLRLASRYLDHGGEPSPEFPFGTPERSVSREPHNRRLANEHDRLVLPRAGLAIAAVSSESAAGGMIAAHAIDDDIATHWHTEWQAAQPPHHPHTLTIDLGTPRLVRGLRLMARQDGSDHGTIQRLDVRVTADAATDKPNATDAAAEPIAPREAPGEAQRFTLRFTKNEQEILLDPPQRGRFITLTTRAAFGDSPYACLANIEVLGEP